MRSRLETEQEIEDATHKEGCIHFLVCPFCLLAMSPTGEYRRGETIQSLVGSLQPTFCGVILMFQAKPTVYKAECQKCEQRAIELNKIFTCPCRKAP